ncbi:MAG: PD-(D/E)XK nuclease family protein [Oscillospiraceae bacterium]|nr:PD-(D/E)XK nuclease family protein [Oscillospiraceae bacterium]
MLNIITGRSGSGKTTYIHSLLKEKAMRGENKLLLIVPEQFSFASERRILTDLDAKNAQNIEVLSFTRLSNYVNRNLGGLSGNFADDDIRLIIMLRALEGLTDKLDLYSKHKKSVSLANQLLVLISEFRRECITPQMLELASKNTAIATLRKKLYELALIYDAYDALFGAMYTDEDTVLDKLSEKLSQNNFFEGYTICIDAFKGFTKQEYNIIRHLIKQADEVYISPCTEDIHKDDPAMISNSVNEMAKRLERIAKEENIGVRCPSQEETGIKAGKRFSSDALKFLEKNIFMPTSNEFTEPSNDIVLFTAQSLYEECDYIASTVHHLIRENDIRLRDIAIITRNEENYKKELLAALSRYNIPVFEDSRQPIAFQPVITLVQNVLQIMHYGFTTENILHYFKTGLSPISLDETAKIENYALMWDIKANSWKNEFTLSPYGFETKDKDSAKKERNELNDIRKRGIKPLIKLYNKIGKEHNVTAEDISEALYDFLMETAVPLKLKDMAVSFNENGFTALASEQDRVWDILMDIIGKLSSVYGDTLTSIETYHNLFSAIASTASFGNIPHGLDEIIIGSADRIRLSSPEIVFVAGCADGIFPRTISQGGLLSKTDRENLRKLGIELSLDNTLLASEERFIAYTAVSAARHKLYVSYHKTEGNESLMPSIIFKNISSLFPKNEVIDASNIEPSYYAETEKSAFHAYANALAASNKKTDELAIKEVLLEKETYNGKLETIDTAKENKPFQIKDKNISTELFRKDMGISASRVDKYYNCPFKYFCEFGMEAKPRKKAELNVAISGTVIHYVLENIIKEHKKEGLIALSEEEKKEAVNKWLKAYIDKELGGADDKSDRFKYLYSRLSNALYDIVNRLCEEFKVTSFIPCDFELSIGKEDGIDAYTIPLPDGGSVSIYGSVDRVDKYEKDGKTYIKVVDYKSGGKDFVLSDILEGLNMQMLIYLFSIEASGKERYGNIVPAGILYYPAKKATISSKSRIPTEKEILENSRANHRGNGLFISNQDVVYALGNEEGDAFLKMFTGRGQNRVLSDNFITLENMGRIKKKIDRTLCEMAMNLHEGTVPATPAFHDNNKNACNYCDYKAVCRVSDDAFHQINHLKNNEVFEILLNEENEGGAIVK